MQQREYRVLVRARDPAREADRVAVVTSTRTGHEWVDLDLHGEPERSLDDV